MHKADTPTGAYFLFNSNKRRRIFPFFRENLLTRSTDLCNIINDPKHVSHIAIKSLFDENIVNWRRTLPGSPDLNPIENLWHELKEHL